MIPRCSRLLPLAMILTITPAFLISGCLWGVVRDANTGAPIPAATVSYTDSNGHVDSTTTNADGWYAFDIADGPVPAAGSATFQVSAPGYQPLSVPRQVQYNDNPHAIVDNPSSFWEVQNFDLVPATSPPPSMTADLAVIDLYPDRQPAGTLWARIANNGPDTLTNVAVQLSCEAKRTELNTYDKTTLGPVIVPVTVSLGPGEKSPFNATIGFDTATYWYDAKCTVQVPFNDPNTANDTYSEVIPPPTGDLELEDIVLKNTDEVGLRVAASGVLPDSGPRPGEFHYELEVRYPDGGADFLGVWAPAPAGSQVFWTWITLRDTASVKAWIDRPDYIPETNEDNNEMTKTCSPTSNSCW